MTIHMIANQTSSVFCVDHKISWHLPQSADMWCFPTSSATLARLCRLSWGMLMLKFHNFMFLRIYHKILLKYCDKILVSK